jgi:hypothetical protein
MQGQTSLNDARSISAVDFFNVFVIEWITVPPSGRAPLHVCARP